MSHEMSVSASNSHRPEGLGSRNATHVAYQPEYTDVHTASKYRKDVDLSGVSAFCDKRLA